MLAPDWAQKTLCIILPMCSYTMAIVFPCLSGLFIKVVRAKKLSFSTFKMETDYLGKRFRILPARPFQFAPRNSVSITRYGNNIYKGVIDWSLNACCKLKLVFWKSIFKITLHTLPCFSFCFFNSILKWRGFIIIKKKVSHACTRTSLVNKLE